LERVAHGEVVRGAMHSLRCEVEARVAGDAGPAREVEPGLEMVGRDAGQAVRRVAERGHMAGEQNVTQAQHPHVHQRFLNMPHILALLPVRILQTPKGFINTADAKGFHQHCRRPRVSPTLQAPKGFINIADAQGFHQHCRRPRVSSTLQMPKGFINIADAQGFHQYCRRPRVSSTLQTPKGFINIADAQGFHQHFSCIGGRVWNLFTCATTTKRCSIPGSSFATLCFKLW
jgi:hypothetical protein